MRRFGSALIAILVVLVMVASQTVVFASAGDMEYNVMVDTGIIPADSQRSYENNAVVTRGEFASALLNLTGKEAYLPPKSVFTDISGHKYEKEIATLAESGIISGYADGSFKPDETITYEQMVKLLVSAAGYDELAKVKGGFPAGYFAIAKSTDITLGVSLGYSDNAGFRDMVKLLYNTANANMLLETSFVQSAEGDSVTFSTDDSRTVFGEYKKIYKVRGIVTATPSTSLNGGSDVGEGLVRIEDVIYDCGVADADEYLGMYVTAYYQASGNGENKVVSIQPESKNTVKTIKAEDVAKDSGEFSYDCFVAYEGDSLKKYTLSKDMDLIYNGKAYTGFDLDTMKPETGNVTLIDNNGDRAYDVVLINEFENFVVESIAKGEMTVYDKYGKSLKLEDVESLSIVSQYGDIMEYNELKEWDVLSVFRSKDNLVVKINVMNDPVTGKVEKLDDEDGVTIDGDTFEVAESFKEALESGVADIDEIKLGQRGVFYLDFDEKIAAANLKIDASWQYAMLVNAAMDDEAFNKTLKLNLYGTNDRFEAYSCASKVNNGKTPEEILSMLQTNGAIVPQLIKFKVNSEGLVNKIVLGDKNAEGDDELRLVAEKEERKYTEGAYRMIDFTNNNILVDGSTILFIAPSSEENYYDEASYSVRNYKFLKHGDWYNISAYDTDFSDLAKVMVVYTSAVEEYPYTSITLVDEIITEIDAEGTVRQKLCGYKWDGTEVSCYEETEGLFDGLEQGDIVRYDLNTKNRITHLKLYFDVSEQPKNEGALVMNEGDSINQPNASVFMQYGVIYEKQGEFIKTTIDIPENINDIPDVKLTYLLNQANYPTSIYLCNTDKNTVTKITGEQLGDYLYSRNSNARALWFSSISRLRFVVIYED